MTSYQSQSVCFSLFYSFSSVFAVPAQSLHLCLALRGGSGLVLHGHVREAIPPSLDAITD